MLADNHNQLTPLQQAGLALKEMRDRLDAAENKHNEPIAIIGLACRFPGASDSKRFWELLQTGTDAVSEVPPERWNLEQYYDANPDENGKVYTRFGGFLQNVDQFDAKFFGISPVEANSLDPQQRLLLEVGWEALENAGQVPQKGSKTGVFVGIGQNDYLQFKLNGHSSDQLDAYEVTGNGFCFASGRLSYFLGLQGPNMAIDAGCASSLITVHLACQSLRNGESNLALAGGVQLNLLPDTTIFLCKTKSLAPDGRCKAFDAAADGYGRGEGCGMVVLKRLSHAIADKDNILAVIQGLAVNHGGASGGFTVPNGEAQQTVIRQALKSAGVEATEIDYVEAHGTGTTLGDPIEVNALNAVYGQDRTRPLMIGTVKANIGHLEAASGVAGLIKVILSLQHKEIPPHLHFKTPSPRIPWDQLSINVPNESTPWLSSEKPRMAGISAFGMSGSNAHVILREPLINEQSLAILPSPMERSHHLLTLSAKTEEALMELVERYKHHLSTHSEQSLKNLCFTASAGRSHFPHRLGVVGESTSQMLEKLTTFSEGSETTGVFQGNVPRRLQPPKIAFLFTGQGAQYVGMGRELYETQPTFRKTLERCDEILHPYLEKPLLDVLFHESSPEDERKILTSRKFSLNKTTYTQPALFALEYALVELWKSWGIEPSVVMGHSLGEYMAACVAGVFSLEDGLKLTARRASLMQSLASDEEMLTVLTTEERVQETCQSFQQEVSIAAINEPENIVIAGQRQAVQSVRETLEKEGVMTYPLNVSQGAHSPLMKSILADFKQIVSEIQFSPPRLNIVSNLTGQVASAEIATPDYWLRHLLQPVRFSTGMETLHALGHEIFMEIGPKPTLLDMGQQCLSEGVGSWLPSLRQWQSDWKQLLGSLGQLYSHGIPINWAGFEQDYLRQRVALPTYPFQRKRYWVTQTENRMNFDQPFEPPSVKQTAATPSRQSPPEQPSLGPTSSQTSRKESLVEQLCELIAELLHMVPSEVEVEMPLLEMGADSIVMMRALQKVEKRYGVKYTVRQLFDELTTLDALATSLDQQLLPEVSTPSPTEATSPTPQSPQTDSPAAFVPQSLPADWNTSGAVEDVMRQQLKVMSDFSQIIFQQLEMLQGKRVPETKVPVQSQKPMVPKPPLNTDTPKNNSPLPAWKVSETRSKQMTSEKQQHLDALIARYTQKTKKSKELTQQYRPVLADNRASAGFRLSTKEMLYTIVGKRARGSKTWDVDDNEYIDITMGFGVNLFGHQPTFITQAIEKQLSENIQVGLQNPLAGEVAQLICELTGMERVTFCNSGTEAVMAALRLACAATGRSKIVQFSMSFHGHFDGTLGTAPFDSNDPYAVPIAPGVRSNIVSDTLMLEYGDFQSLEVIKAHAGELAAVIVEPVQSRRPELQPKAFLQQLRKVTLEAKIPLIFDEMITGFRICPGGAQAWFGVQADMATYGKIVGGGMPIGIVAGKAAYMDGIDGGQWNYGDASYPQTDTTFFAGTFCKHPLAMAVAQAVLQEIKKQGPSLQEALNQRTTYLVTTLNNYFEKEAVPIRMVNFGSLFRFTYSGNLDLLFYHLIEKGVYIWEGRNCFLSTAHTEEDVNFLIKVVQESVKALQEGGFLPKNQQSETLALETAKGKDPLPAHAKHEDVSPSKIPLTEAQKQLWFLTQLSDESSLAYNVSLRLQLRGTLNRVAMQQAIQHVVDRHDSLRTTISQGGDFQHTQASLAIEIPFVDFSQASDQERTTQLADFFKQANCKPFDLTQGPLIRFQIVKLKETLHILDMTGHHIVLDGLSMDIIMQEIGDLYSVACQGSSDQLEPPQQFHEYIQWQTQHSQTPEIKTQETYWLEKLSGPIPVLDLPTDHPVPPIKSYRGGRHTLRLSEELCHALKDLGKKQKCTPFMVFLSAYTGWLHRLTGQKEVLVGIPTTGRQFAGGDHLVGYCTHLLPIASQIAGKETFLDHLGAMRLSLLEAYENQDYPFANLINKLNLRKKTNQSSLVSAIFNLDRPSRPPNIFELDVEWLAQPIHFSAFDINFNLTEVGEAIVLDCDYNLDLFEGTTIERFIGHFHILLESIVTSPEQPVCQLPLLPQEERHQLLVEWNDTATEYPRDQTFVDWFEAQVEQAPNAIAVTVQNQNAELQQLTYRELNDRANQLAHHLQTLGVGPEVLVGIHLERSLSLIVSILGTLKAGGAYLPLDPTFPIARLTYMLSDSQASVLLTQSSLKNRFSETTATVVCLDTDSSYLSNLSKENPKTKIDPKQLVYVLYTSGSTGQPKGVMIEHRGFMNSLKARMDYYGGSGNFLLLSSVSFDSSVAGLFHTLCSGGNLVLPQDEKLTDPDYLWDLIHMYRVGMLLTVPSFYEMLLNHYRPKQNVGLENVIVAGEACVPLLVKNHYARFPNITLYNEYGPTEGTVWSTVYRCLKEDDQRTSIPIGKLISNVQGYILDEHLNPTPIGIPGELYIGGASLARGYFNQPELTQDKFVTNPFSTDFQAKLYKTGDLVRYLADGNMEFLGRVDNQVKLRGFRIELGEIEAVLTTQPKVQETVVVINDSVQGDPCLVAYLVAKSGHVLDSDELRLFLSQSLPNYMIPSFFVTLASLPLLPNGKVDRQALQASDTHLQVETVSVLPQTEVEQQIAQVWQTVLQLEKVGIHDNFFEVGGHSLLMVPVQKELQTIFGQSLSLIELFQYPTIHSLAKRFVSDNHPKKDKRVKTSTVTENEDIAIIGMSGRFPGAKNIDTFWKNLQAGVESITFFTDEELLADGADPALIKRPDYVKAHGALEAIEFFDADFFGYSPREAEIMDPQQRFFLECAWEAIEDAGYNVDQIDGSVGVYAGVGMNMYLLKHLYPNRDVMESMGDFQVAISSKDDFMPTRVSYKLNLKGPSINVQTACSTSLVAVHLARQSLLHGECDMALAGGVTIGTPQKVGYLYQPDMIASPDGHCRAFDANASGTVDGSGVGIVLLKRLDPALRDGDVIHAIIKGSAINNDGAAKVGYTAPSIDGQVSVITEAMGDLDPNTITYVETHGTGTILGDPIEIAALTQAFQPLTDKKGFCAIGSVKTNIGHLDTAAGVAGLIKTVLALKHKTLPPSLHFEQPNPKIDFANSPFFVNTTASEWKSNGVPRRAGVSSFGIGGTNAHVIVEEPPLRSVSPEKDSEKNQDLSWKLLLLSARTPSALEKIKKNLATHLKEHPDLDIADVAYTLCQGRKTFAYRQALVCQTGEDTIQALASVPEKAPHQQEAGQRPIGFMFSGQGAQYVNMTLELYQQEPIFQEHVDRCSEMLKSHLSFDLRTVLYPNAEQTDSATKQLEQTSVAQPALFVIEYALAQLWMAWGLRPVAMIGHSIGEYVAACLADVLSLEEALALVVTRGQLMQSLPTGAMLSIALPETEIKPHLTNTLSLAVHNAPSQCVVSGPTPDIVALEKRLKSQKVECIRLHTSHAFHSAMMEPILEKFMECVKKVSLKPPQIPYVSNISGTWVTTQEVTAPDYWVRHLRSTVRFSEGIQTLIHQTENVLLEIGPGRTLTALANQQINQEAEPVAFSSVRHPKDYQSDSLFLLTTLGKLYLAGVSIDWSAFYDGKQRKRLSLPPYPFERQSFWIAPEKHHPATVPIKKQDSADWFYTPTWKRTIASPFQPNAMPEQNHWLVFMDVCGVGDKLVKQLEKSGQLVITVHVGNEYTQTNPQTYTLNPQRSEHYETLFKELKAQNTPHTLVHLWGLTVEQALSKMPFQGQQLGFSSLMLIAKALQKNALTDALQIEVVSNHTQSVTGEEVLYPEKTTVWGPVKSLSQEFSNIRCRSIDIALPESGPTSQVIDQLLGEFMVQPENNPVPIALRGHYRWEQTLVHQPFPKPAHDNPGLRKNGVYLITGGLDGLGYTFAEYLATTVQARLALVSNNGLPKVEPSSPAVTLDMQAEQETFSQIEAKIAATYQNIQLLSDLPELQATLDELCTTYLYNYFASHLKVEAGTRYTRAELLNQLKIIPVFEKFYDVMLNILAEDSIIQVDADQIEFLTLPKAFRDPQDLKTKIVQDHPELASLLELVEHCTSHYGQALSGEIKAISVLYPEGNADLLKKLEKDTVDWNTQHIYIKLLRNMLTQAVQKAPSKKLRVLEVGAGTGSLTEFLIPGLKQYDVEYHFTDLGKSFILRAQRLFKPYEEMMSYGVFDISKDPVSQGYDNHSYDVIVGFNVVHATRDVSETVSHLKQLLAPKGLLCLVESVDQQRWVDLTWGLAEGWWYFEDTDIRKHSPLMTIPEWEDVLAKQGFHSVSTFPQEQPKREKADIALLISQQPTEIENFNPLERAKQNYQQAIAQKIAGLEKLGSEVLEFRSDTSDLNQMQSVYTQTTKRFGEVHGVIQTALIAEDHLIHSEAIEASEKAVAHAIKSTQTLEALFKETKLDFMMLHSSDNGLSGGKGYVGSNAIQMFLNAYAHAKAPQSETSILSINWDNLSDRGKETHLATQEEPLSEVKPHTLTSREVATAFSHILSCPTPQIVVSKSDKGALDPTFLIENRNEPHQRHSLESPETEKQGYQKALGKKPDIADWFYKPTWKQSELPFPPETAQSERWLVFEDECGLGSRLVDKLKKMDQEVITVKAGKQLAKLSDGTYTINPHERDDYINLFKQLSANQQQPQAILHLWTVTHEPNESRLAWVDQAQDIGFYSLLFVAQSLAAQNSTNKFKMVAISNHLHAVTGDEVLCPEKSTIFGAIKIIPLEYSNISCQSIDVVLPRAGTKKEHTLINQLWGEISKTALSSPEIVAYRGPYRWTKTFEPIRLEEQSNKDTPRLRENGVYLITGGLGGMGFTVMEYLAKTLQAKLTLIGRSTFPQREEWESWLTTHPEEDAVSLKIQKIQMLEKMGAEVLVMQADVSHYEQMQNVITTTEKQFGPINGVFHGAGMIDYAGVIERRTSRKMTDEVLAPKVKGTVVLDSLLNDLDFFILCSSQGTILYQSKIGESGYCAANDFLDAFCYYKTFQDDTFTVTINWNDWLEVGMAINAAEQSQKNISELAKVKVAAPQQGAILPSEGINVFTRVLSSCLYPQLVVSTQDLAALMEDHEAYAKHFLISASEDSTLLSPLEPSDSPLNQMEQTLATIWQKLLGVKEINLSDNFFDLGGDSLLATRLTSLIRETCNLGLSMNVVFEKPTLAELADHIQNTLSMVENLTTLPDETMENHIEEEI